MTKTPDPYNGKRIFKAIPAVEVILAQTEARRADQSDPMAQFYAKPEVYQDYYTQALKRLSADDMITVAEAARRINVTAHEYKALAQKGQALLIAMGKKHVVPAWSIKQDGTVDQLRLDIAREFVLEGRSYFKFMDYLKFMTEEKANISEHIQPETLSIIFHTAGLSAFDCSLNIKAKMNQLADLWNAEPFYRETLIKCLDKALTQGGWDPSGGLSRPFRDKYKIPGLTIHEERMAPRP